MRPSMMSVARWLSVFLAVVSAQSEKALFKKVGNDVVLQPGVAFVPGTITSITWKVGPDIAMEWDETGMDSFRQFKERGRLNITTGELTIIRLTPQDGGLYTSEVNNANGSPVLLTVISAVPTPTITKSCDNEMTSCSLTCDGNTTGAEPVTYKWRSDDKELTDTSKEKRITEEDNSHIKEFSCELENPVSRESSQPIHNPLITTSEDPAPVSNLKISTGLTVFISLLAAVVLLVLIHRTKAGMWFFQKESMPWEADFWRKNERPRRETADSNGTAAHQEKEQTDEETPMTGGQITPRRDPTWIQEDPE